MASAVLERYRAVEKVRVLGPDQLLGAVAANHLLDLDSLAGFEDWDAVGLAQCGPMLARRAAGAVPR